MYIKHYNNKTIQERSRIVGLSDIYNDKPETMDSRTGRLRYLDRKTEIPLPETTDTNAGKYR